MSSVVARPFGFCLLKSSDTAPSEEQNVNNFYWIEKLAWTCEASSEYPTISGKWKSELKCSKRILDVQVIADGYMSSLGFVGLFNFWLG